MFIGTDSVRNSVRNLVRDSVIGISNYVRLIDPIFRGAGGVD